MWRPTFAPHPDAFNFHSVNHTVYWLLRQIVSLERWWIISDSNRSDILSARQVATPSSPITHTKSDFQATSKITTPLRPVELSAVLCPWRFPVSTRSLTYTRSDGTYSNICGAGGDSGTRTHTTSRPSDFESDTSTDSIISPNITHFRVCTPTAASLVRLSTSGWNR